ncbi:hypothetical protein TorRG33x02_291240 [Trema orientale]|uniref:Uncharacterized protein n=1 Tax=Trema orientale TaxID=63057 RepID=A0A2P5CBL9_TREOI|nr:hypothetical protein TorRG33x02_291240 [Trema orientale]
MSRAPTTISSATTSTWLQVSLEAAPPSVLRLERGPTFQRRLDTIQEEREGFTTPHSEQNYCSNHANPPAFGFRTAKYDDFCKHV